MRRFCLVKKNEKNKVTEFLENVCTFDFELIFVCCQDRISRTSFKLYAKIRTLTGMIKFNQKCFVKFWNEVFFRKKCIRHERLMTSVGT